MIHTGRPKRVWKGRNIAIWTVLSAVVVFILLSLISDLEALEGSLAGFPLVFLVPIGLLSLGNYLLRYVKWHWYLKLLGHRIDRWPNLLVFLSGFALTVCCRKESSWISPCCRQCFPASNCWPIWISPKDASPRTAESTLRYPVIRSISGFQDLDRLTNVALPRVRDFKGISPKAFDGRGNYTLGIREQIIFPEVDYDKVEKITGMNVTVCTTAETDAEAKALLGHLGMPFRQ